MQACHRISCNMWSNLPIPISLTEVTEHHETWEKCSFNSPRPQSWHSRPALHCTGHKWKSRVLGPFYSIFYLKVNVFCCKWFCKADQSFHTLRLKSRKPKGEEGLCTIRCNDYCYFVTTVVKLDVLLYKLWLFHSQGLYDWISTTGILIQLLAKIILIFPAPSNHHRLIMRILQFDDKTLQFVRKNSTLYFSYVSIIGDKKFTVYEASFVFLQNNSYH